MKNFQLFTKHAINNLLTFFEIYFFFRRFCEQDLKAGINNETNELLNENHNSNHTQISGNNDTSYTDFMLSSHLKLPILSSSNNNNYQEKVLSTMPTATSSPISSPNINKQSKIEKQSKKSLNNTFKNQFSNNSQLQNKMQQLASVNDFDKYHRSIKNQKNFSEINKFDSFPESQQFLNGNLTAHPNLAAYFPSSLPTPPTSTSKPPSNPALFAASSIYSAYLAAAAANRTQNVNPYLPYLHAIAQQHSLQPTQQQQQQQKHQNNHNELFINAASAFAAASSSFGSINNQQNVENKKSNYNKTRSRSRSRSPQSKKKTVRKIESLMMPVNFQMNERQLLKRELSNKVKHEKITKKAKYEIVTIEEPLDLSLKPNDEDKKFMNEIREEEYEGDNDDEDEDDGEVYDCKNNKKNVFLKSTSFTVDKILSNSLIFKAKRNEVNGDEEDRNQQQNRPQSPQFSPSASENYFEIKTKTATIDTNNNFDLFENQYKCEKCDKFFTKSFKLQSHILNNKHLSNEDFDKSQNCCFKCKREFLKQNILEKHVLNENINSICSDSDTNSVSSYEEDNSKSDVNNSAHIYDNSALDLTKNKQTVDFIYSTTLPSPSQSQTSASNSPNSSNSSSSSNDSHFNNHHHQDLHRHHHSTIHHNNGLLQSLKCIK
jgi:hypothetical protein